MNSIFVIAPYKWNDLWVFDDPDRGLVREAFVAGADTVIDSGTARIPGAKRGFILIFSATEFPTAQISLTRIRGNKTQGNTYRCDQTQAEAWLCPALYRYFPKAPERLFAEFRPKQKNKTNP